MFCMVRLFHRLRLPAQRVTPAFRSGGAKTASLGRTSALCLALAAMVALQSCSGVDKDQAAIAAMKWGPGAGGIRINLEADKDLNLYDGRHHTILLAVCQAVDPNIFLSQLGDKNSIATLLWSGQRSGVALAGFNRFVISPGQKDVLT